MGDATWLQEAADSETYAQAETFIVFTNMFSLNANWTPGLIE